MKAQARKNRRTAGKILVSPATQNDRLMKRTGGLSLSLPLKMHYLETFRRIDSLLLRRARIFKETGAEEGSLAGPAFTGRGGIPKGHSLLTEGGVLP